MAERSIQELRADHHHQKTWEESLFAALAQHAESRLVTIRELSKLLAILAAISEYATKLHQKMLIEESNSFPLSRDDYFAQMHQRMQSRYGAQREKLFRAEYDHDHPRRQGWGRWRNETREQIQPRVDRASRKMINIELALAEEEGREPFQANFFHALLKTDP